MNQTNAKIVVYKAITDAIKSIGEIKTVRRYNSQDIAFENEKQHNFPIAYVYFQSIDWNENNLANQRRSQEQMGSADIGVRLCFYSLKDDNDTFVNDLLIVQKVYEKLSLLKDVGFNGLVRISETDDIENDNVRVWETVFRTELHDSGIDKRSVSNVQVLVTGEIEK